MVVVALVGLATEGFVVSTTVGGGSFGSSQRASIFNLSFYTRHSSVVIRDKAETAHTNELLRLVNRILQSSLKGNLPDLDKSETMCESFQLAYMQLLLQNLHRDAIKEGLLTPDGSPLEQRDDETDDGASVSIPQI